MPSIGGLSSTAQAASNAASTVTVARPFTRNVSVAPGTMKSKPMKAGFKTLPDPRNLGQKHVQAMVEVWQRERLAPGTIQIYLSLLRGLAMWMGKHGFVRQPQHYGLELAEYQRTGLAERDKSWSAQGIDVAAQIEKVGAYDRYVGASLRLCLALGLRRKESVMFKPHRNLLGWQEATGYGRRALVETTMGRYKSIIGDRLRSRGDAAQRTEAVVGVAVLNRMLGAARPNSARSTTAPI